MARLKKPVVLDYERADQGPGRKVSDRSANSTPDQQLIIENEKARISIRACVADETEESKQFDAKLAREAKKLKYNRNIKQIGDLMTHLSNDAGRQTLPADLNWDQFRETVDAPRGSKPPIVENYLDEKFMEKLLQRRKMKK